MTDDPLLAVEPAAALGVLKDFQTRFLYPFVFERRRVAAASAALRAELWPGRDAKPHDLWECAEPHHLYRDELLDHVVGFLFTSAEVSGCGYLKIDDAAANAWFAQTEVQLHSGIRLPVRLVPGVRMEVFLSPQGVGVLSVALTPEQRGLPLDEAVAFNYQLAQFRRRLAAKIRKRHPKDDLKVWERIPPAEQGRIPAAPEDDAPLLRRLGAPGGSFTLDELIGHLLEPLQKHGLRSTQSELSVYTVARLGRGADFGDPAVRTRLAAYLSALAQVEEPGHAGMAPERLGVADAVLNRRHWAAVGLLGAAHLAADQGDVAFDDQKMPIIRDKYFMPFLVALLQRVALNRGIEEAGQILARPPREAPQALIGLREDLLRFAVEGHFTQVSSRQALHRFYQLAREGLDIPSAWEEVRRAIADLDAQFAAQRQTLLTRDMARNLGVVARVQTMVEWIEVFIVSVYFAHLWHMLTHANGSVERLFPRSHDWVVHGGVVVCALLGGLITFLLVKPWKHVDEPD
ncbi:MAG TPA: hypothetical protein VG013_40700 [Gemmataceae bacterium]|jgi:hypothetical protein|nr:hypothetical protein [Gemmataceae bacterium]